MRTPRPPGTETALQHCISGPPLHPNAIIDRLVRLYVYAMLYLEMEPHDDHYGLRWRGYAARDFEGWMRVHAERFPWVFRMFVDYGDSFGQTDAEAVRWFVGGLPDSLSGRELEEVIMRVAGVRYGPMTALGATPRYFWQVLELPGSMGRYSSLLCRAYPELSLTRNCTVLVRDHIQFREGAMETTVAGIHALLAGAGPRDLPAIERTAPRDLRELGQYHLIVGPKSAVGARHAAGGEEARWKVDAGTLESYLVPGGRLCLLDVSGVPV